MSLLSEDEIIDLSINRMIFHVVKPDSAEPIFLSEVSPPQCEDFFLERVKETLRGSAYLFVAGSGLPALLRDAVSKERDLFVDTSHKLAIRFKEKVGQDKRLAPGVLMFFELSTTNKERLCAIIKYEHQQVVSYSYLTDEDGTELLDGNGNKIPNLEDLVDTFTQDKKAMQKSAVIRFASDKDSIVVIDHSSKRYRDASQHFANYLDIKRALEPEELTKRLENAVVEAIKKHKDEVPEEVGKAPKRHVRDAMSRMDGFDHEKVEEFIGSIVHGIPEDAKILKTFRTKLSNNGISTEAFEFAGALPPRPEYRKVVTHEGVAVFFNKKHEEDKKVQIERTGNGVTIKVESTGLEQNDELDKMPQITR